ncbi:hypothetical protein ACJMK2_033027 [Sinanodonta woodiana]|uniref:DUF19 domain-containing protein n=1 Tax=Sinanodonta woodiana TaxID=1069815 RepID=A0ABD3X3R9_SINWO
MMKCLIVSRNVECILACFDVSIGTCSGLLLYFTFDIGSYKSAYRTICQNQNATVVAFKNCLQDVETMGTECFVPFRAESYEIVLRSYNQPTEYVITKCRSLQNLSNCLASEPKPGCTEESVTLVKRVLKTFFLPHRCEIDSAATVLWDNGPIQCGCKGIVRTFQQLYEKITVMLMVYFVNCLAL